MDIDAAVDIIKRRNKGDKSVTLAAHAAASVFVMTHYQSQRDGMRDLPRHTPMAHRAGTRDSAPDLPDLGTTMPMPEGINPLPPKIERATGISLRSLAIAAGDQNQKPPPAGWSEGGYMGGLAHPVTAQMVGMTEGLTTEQVRGLAAKDAARCRAGLQAIQAANKARWG